MVESNWKSQYYWFKMSFSFETGVIVVLGFGFSAFFLGGGAGGCEGCFFTLPEQC